jgi:hypothetical protein
LNFSGHYRPKLSGEYCRYTYRTIAEHPLLTLSPNCGFKGRVFKDCDALSETIQFTRGELASDDPEFDCSIESLYLF